MSATIIDYINTVKSPSAQRILKIEILDSNYNTVDTITPDVIDGSIQLSSDSGSRRSCNIVFNNYLGDYIPDPDSLFWINTLYKIYTGYVVNGEEMYFSRGVFCSGEPQVNSQFAEQTVDLQLYDQWTKLDGTIGGTIETTYTIPVGTSVESAVRAVFAEAGETRPVIIENTSEVTPYTIIAKPNDNYASILTKLAEMISYVVYYDNEGYPRFESPVNNINNIITAGSVWDFVTNEGLYMGARRRFEFSKVYNYVKVIGSNVNGLTYSAIASDTNVSSSTRIALIGKRTFVVEDDLISSTPLCQARADYELQKAIQILESVDAESVPIDIIEGDSVVTVSDSGLGTSGDRYLVKSVSFPLLNTGTMTMNLWKARSFS
jgi:hypothetical protein